MIELLQHPATMPLSLGILGSTLFVWRTYLRLDEGRALWYRNRWVRSERVLKALGESPNGRNLGPGPNTNVIGHGGRTWALRRPPPSRT